MATTDSDRLARMEQRQEIMIAVLHQLTESVGAMNATIEEMAKWLKQPSSSDLPDALKALLAAVHEMRGEMRDLPVVVARAVIDGDISGRG